LEIIFQDAVQSGFIEDDDVVQAFAAKGTDQPLDIGVLPRAAGRSKNFVNAHAFGRLRKLVPVYSIAVTEQIPWCAIPGESFENLVKSLFYVGKICLESGGREGIRTPGLLVANSGENKLRQSATIT